MTGSSDSAVLDDLALTRSRLLDRLADLRYELSEIVRSVDEAEIDGEPGDVIPGSLLEAISQDIFRAEDAIR